MNRKVFSFLAIVLVCILFLSVPVQAAEKKQYKNWQEIAKDMAIEFDKAKEHVSKKEYKEAYKDMNKAYFGYYETTGFEVYVGNGISRKRVSHIEGVFRDIKHTLAGYQKVDDKELKDQIENLKFKVYRDAMVLDGVADKDSDDSIGKAIYNTAKGPVKVDQSKIWWKDFGVSFGLLLREGLEALLVVVAIVTYLVKTGNKHLCKGVYYGVLAAVVFSFILAILLNLIFNGAGTSQELIEGFTMFLAVIVLFYVSNWMLHKSEEAAWEEYIHSQVTTSVNKQNHNALIFASFIAVAREGAELVLFYKASFTGGNSKTSAIASGFLVGCVVLAVIWVIFRYSTIKIPLKPFFAFTSILLFLMCISFVGKGVVELTEAGFISGATSLPFMNGFSIPDLGIFDRAETMLPQLILVIAAVWMFMTHKFSTKRRIKEYEKKVEI